MFKLVSSYSPAGDQPTAIEEIVSGLANDQKEICLLGVTGSGKTFTMANVIQQSNRPALILTHNKTLTAQLYGEFSKFFPQNAVEYFVSYYDYYQPEAFIPSSNTYIEKDLAINEEVDKLRLRATSSILSGRRDIVVVASVSCIYGMGNPDFYKDGIIRLTKGDTISRNMLLHLLVDILYSRSEYELDRATFRVRGDMIDVNLPYAEHGVRITFFDDDIESIHTLEISSGKVIEEQETFAIFPANLYLAPKDKFKDIIKEIEDELKEQVEYFESHDQMEEAKRLYERTQYDLEMIRELGYCSGIENYSRFLDGRERGTRPFCLMDYFPDDFIMFVDESHVTLPQVRGMFGGDRARKINLVDHGFRLPSAMDNRPLNFDEFEGLIPQVVYVSATPGDYELQKTGGEFVEQIVRPTGLLDPIIEVRPSLNQIDDLLNEINLRVEKDERVLVTTLTKRMSEELSKYFLKVGVRCKYIHSEIDTMERVEIIRNLRLGEFDVLIGVNLLREGLDIPEVSLVAILDADKEGFLRNDKSLTQTAGRAARNENGRVIMYADRITGSMERTIDETKRRRQKQMEHNELHGIRPTTIFKSKEEIMEQESILSIRRPSDYIEHANAVALAAEEEVEYNTPMDVEKRIKTLEKQMRAAAKEMDFLAAAGFRDEIDKMKDKLKTI